MSDGAVRARTRVEVDAFEMTAERCESRNEWPEWLRGAIDTHKPAQVISDDDSIHVFVQDDWIIHNAGELSVCTPEEYEAGYEAVGEQCELCCDFCGSTEVRDPKPRVWCESCETVRPATATRDA